jgi:2-amino-4-hydroxy-6-hydroxymethyldihydropteridine diphosphokinase
VQGSLYVALGGNLGDRLATLRGAVRGLAALPGTAVVRCSPVFETRPIGPSELPYLNAVVELATELAPEVLMAALKDVEVAHGRTRHTRWEARTLDLDILVWPGVVRDTEALRVPHPELARRDFVLAPLATLVPELRPHGGATVAQLLAALAGEERTILRQLPELLC